MWVMTSVLSPGNQNDVSFLHFPVSIEHLYPLFACHEIALLHQVAENLKRPRVFLAGSPVADQCHKLAKAAAGKSGLEHRSHLLTIASVVLADEFKNVQRKRTRIMGAEDHSIHVFEQLAVSELLALSVDELAGKFNCSRRHLNRLFHQYFGASVGALKMEIRLLKAVSLLRDSDAKVINVAKDCAFKHLGLFNTCFKRRFGVSPGQWRKMAVQAGGNLPPARDCAPGCQQRASGLCPLTISSDRVVRIPKEPARPSAPEAPAGGLPDLLS